MGNSARRYRCRTGKKLARLQNPKSFGGTRALLRRKTAPASSATLPKGARERERTEIPYFLYHLLKKPAEKGNKSFHRWECDGCSLQSTASRSTEGFLSYLDAGRRGDGERQLGEGASEGSAMEKQSVVGRDDFRSSNFLSGKGKQVSRLQKRLKKHQRCYLTLR